MKILATYNIKGGVGKTATAVNLAALSAEGGYRTLVWDLDPQGAASFYFRIRAKVKGGAAGIVKGRRALDGAIRGTDYAGLDLLPADFRYRHLDIALADARHPERRRARLLEPLADSNDHVIHDCAPSISRVSESVFEAADALLVPTIPTPLSLRTLGQLLKHLRDVPNTPTVLPFLCMVDRRKALHRQFCRWAEQASVGFLAAAIPYSSTVERMGLRRRPLTEDAPRSPATTAYRALWEETLQRLVGEARLGPSRQEVKAMLRRLERGEDLVGEAAPADD